MLKSLLLYRNFLPVAQWIEQRPSKPLVGRSNRLGQANNLCLSGGMVYTADLKSAGVSLVGSSPASGTNGPVA
jgi:hypothetical protein